MNNYISSEKQLKAFDSYADAKTNLKDIGFFLYLDIEVDKESKWVYEYGKISYSLVEQEEEASNQDDADDRCFDFCEHATVHKANALFTVFKITDFTGHRFFLLLLNKNKV